MKLTEVKEYFKNRLKHAPNCAEEYQTAIEALEELEEYRATMQSPDDIHRMQEEFYKLAVKNNELEKQILMLKGEGANEKCFNKH